MSHKFIIAKIDRVLPIEGATNIQEIVVLGEHLVGSKTWSVGDVGVFIPTDLQLSDLYCRANNLYRDSSKNEDVTKKGFFEDNRRVRAQTFMKVKSTGLFMPISSLSSFHMDVEKDKTYSLGYEFDSVHGFQMCEKYISPIVKNRKWLIEMSKWLRLKNIHYLKNTLIRINSDIRLVGLDQEV